MKPDPRKDALAEELHRDLDARIAANPPPEPEPKPKTPKKPSLVQALSRFYAEKPERLEDIVTAIDTGAKQGDVQLIKIVLDRLDGPVKQDVSIDHSGAVAVLTPSERRARIAALLLKAQIDLPEPSGEGDAGARNPGSNNQED